VARAAVRQAAPAGPRAGPAAGTPAEAAGPEAAARAAGGGGGSAPTTTAAKPPSPSPTTPADPCLLDDTLPVCLPDPLGDVTDPVTGGLGLG
jgi:hypothetical protein